MALRRNATRRRFLAFGAIGAGALAATVAGCGSGDDLRPELPAGPAASPAGTGLVPAPGGAGEASARVLVATRAFLDTLDATQLAAAVAERSPANLAQWSNLPDQLFKRGGLRMDKLSENQQKAAQAVLAAALSPEGYNQVTQICSADGVLANAGGINLDFGADHYWLRFVGAPSVTTPWTIQYGGHHLAVNVTLVGPRMTHAPSLWGAQPAIYPQGGGNVEPLSGETSKAYALINLLGPAQQAAAMLQTRVTEIVLGPGQDGKKLAPEGAKASTFNPAQKEALLALVQEWLRPLNAEAAAPKIAAAQAEVDQMSFAWYGAREPGQPIYYRVQSPSFHVEFAHQQGQGANAGGVTHIHAIYREPNNDYGVGMAG